MIQCQDQAELQQRQTYGREKFSKIIFSNKLGKSSDVKLLVVCSCIGAVFLAPRIRDVDDKFESWFKFRSVKGESGLGVFLEVESK